MAKKEKKPVTYKEAGVDIKAGEEVVARIKRRVPLIGGFSGAFPLDTKKYKNPVFVASADGVGTKLLIADMMERYNTVGVDLVAMIVNDLVVYGAKPLFILDYYATGQLKVERVEEVISGILDGCRQSSCQLLGGETAELPGLYYPGQYDLAGFGVGVVEKDEIIDGHQIKPGDILMGVASNGLHSNGYSLARKVLLEEAKFSPRNYIEELLEQLGETLLRPTLIYVDLVLFLKEQLNVKGIAHITGGGIPGNLRRILPRNANAQIFVDVWDMPPIFGLIRKVGPVKTQEMYETFNMGVGMILAVAPEDEEKVVRLSERKKHRAFPIGDIKKGEGKVILRG